MWYVSAFTSTCLCTTQFLSELMQQKDELTKQRPGQSAVFYTLAAEIKHQCKPFLTVSITVKGHTKAVILRVENNSMSVSGI